ncbi:uncharacterized protein LOC119683043 [Teleopsis dalmanni]|uniref:uncharacterized protein LOC119683043 n=1 Tax=Teleopsis dalmanni TaxID=139649 RepID=UPI0018CF3B1E|nr:uncharacterized protein LOC119683043 [Teleopsis dalmanni]
MTSTELKIGLTGSARPSSRVLKPPGGGHSNIFAEPEVAVNAPRPKYNQQNSSNLNACMGSTDPNQKVEQLRHEIEQSKQEQPKASAETKKDQPKDTNNAANGNGAGANDQNARGRIPPGGFSSGGFW